MVFLFVKQVESKENSIEVFSGILASMMDVGEITCDFYVQERLGTL